MNGIEFLTGPEVAGRRLDSVLRENAPRISRAALQRAVSAGRCLVDGRVETRPAARIRSGQRIVLDIPETRESPVPEAGALDVLWHDEHLLVCNKQAGLTVHPCPSCRGNTLVQRLLARFPRLAALEGQRPGIVHRLDKDTSGLLTVALDERARLALTSAFADRRVRKEYLALVSGVPAEEGECRESVGRHPVIKVKMAIVQEEKGGKAAHTSWKRLWSAPGGRASLLAVCIHTGRTHQIRVHMAHLGHPLLGDALYAPRDVRAAAPRQMLHAWKLAFAHPRGGEELRFVCPPPEDMPQAALAACERMERVVIVGNPGSGKTALLRHLAGRGVSVFSADEAAAGLYARGGEATQWIRRRFGEGMLTPEGAVDKKALFAALCADPALYREVEALVHPFVRQGLENFWRARENAGDALALAEVPLYLECGWKELFSPAPLLVGVHSSLPVRLRRLAAARGWTEAKAAALEARQWPQERKMAACDLLVNNDGPPEALAALAGSLLERLAGLAEDRLRAERDKLESLW
ncbi:MAG: dephospho-CoA kinase [Desulfovibrio sp.]|nr:dephospho-CoA kinase [Desulfovibrio sp.]